MLYKFASFKGISPQFPCDDDQLGKLNAMMHHIKYQMQFVVTIFLRLSTETVLDETDDLPDQKAQKKGISLHSINVNAMHFCLDDYFFKTLYYILCDVHRF